LENTQWCDGSQYDGQSTELYCDVPVKEVLRLQPYSLAFNELVVAKVQAYNARGWSDFSPINVVGERI